MNQPASCSVAMDLWLTHESTAGRMLPQQKCKIEVANQLRVENAVLASSLGRVCETAILLVSFGREEHPDGVNAERCAKRNVQQSYEAKD